MNPLIALDKKFCLDCQTKKEVAWMSYLADETMMGTSKHHPYITDKDTIQLTMKQVFALDNISFTWEPHHAMLSKDQSLGFTTGHYTRTYMHNGKEHTDIGKYITIWKRVEDTYKIVFDMGN